MSAVLTTKRKIATRKVAKALTRSFEPRKQTRTAGLLGNGLSIIDGQLYPTGNTNGHGTTPVINIGRAAAAVYVPQTAGQITFPARSGGGCGSSGGESIGIHDLDGPYHSGTLAQSQAPWAALDSDLQAHVNDPIHHNRLHDILDEEDHYVFAERYSVIGTPNARDTLDVWLTGSDGRVPGTLLRSDQIGDLYLNTLFADHAVRTESFGYGYGGYGFQLDYGVTNEARSFLEVDDLSVRGRMSVRELIVRKIRVTHGDLMVSSGGEVESVIDFENGTYQLTFREEHGLFEDDLIRAQAFTGLGVYQVNATVLSVITSKVLVMQLNSGDTPVFAFDTGSTVTFARHGNTSDPDRQGLVYLSSDDTGAPFIKVIDGIDSWAKWGDPDSLKVLMGRIAMSHPLFGVLDTYGLLAHDAFLTGTVAAGGGDSVMGIDGLILQAGTTGNFGWSNRSDKITFSENPLGAQPDDDVIAQIGAMRFNSGSNVHRQLSTIVQSGTETDTDASIVEMNAQFIDPEADVPIQYSRILLGANNGAPYVTIGVQGSTSAQGVIALAAPTTNVWGHLRFPYGGDIGTAVAPVGTLYADNLVILNEVNYDNPGMVNDTRYMTRTELTTAFAGFAPVVHSHPGIVTSGDLSDALDDYALITYVDAAIAAIPAPDLSNYWTKTQSDGRYAQDTEFDAHVGAVNPHGTGLSDLLTRPYSALTGRTHVLATNTGLGDDHSIAGATTGYVLRATGASAARFMRLDFSDLSGNLAYGDLTDRTHDVIDEHSIVAPRYSVIGTPTAIDTLAVWETDSDGTPGNVLLRTGDSGEISLQTITGYNGALRINSTLQSTGFDSAATIGWQLGTTNQILSNATITGSLTAAVYELGSTVVGASEQLFSSSGGGKLKSAATLDTNSQDDFTISIEDPKLGHVQIAEVGDYLVIRGIAYDTPDFVNEGATVAEWEFLPFAASSEPSWMIREIVARVSAVTDQATHYDYDIKLKMEYWGVASTGRCTFPPGTAVANLGNPENDVGGVQISSAPGKGPYVDVWSLISTEGNPSKRHHIRIGKMSSLDLGIANEWGLMAGDHIEHVSPTNRYAIFSNKRMLLNNVDQNFADPGGNTALKITASGGIDLFYNASNAASATRERRLSWLDDDNEDENFFIGPDPLTEDAFSLWSVLNGSYATLQLIAAPPWQSWSSQNPGEDVRYAGIFLQSREISSDNADDDGYSLISVYAQDTVLITNVQIAGSFSFSPYHIPPNTPDDLTAGGVYVDDNGFLKMVQRT